MIERISALLLRYLFLYRRNLARAGQIFFWPVMDLLVWGFITRYLESATTEPIFLFFIGGMIFWDILYRTQQAVTLSLSEEIWSKNLLNLFLAPISIFEYLIATCLMGVLKAIATATLLTTLALLLYSFNVFSIGFAVIPFFASLMMFGWTVGICTMVLILRYGQAAEALVWGVPFLIQPISAVFYPVSVLPGWMQIVAWSLPSTYVFEGMRHAMRTGEFRYDLFAWSIMLNIIYLIASAFFFRWMFERIRDRGLLSRLGTE